VWDLGVFVFWWEGDFGFPKAKVASSILAGGATFFFEETTQNGGNRCSCGTKAALAIRTERDAIGRSGTWAGAMGGQRDPARHEQDVSRQDSDFLSTLGDGSKVVRSASGKRESASRPVYALP